MRHLLSVEDFARRASSAPGELGEVQVYRLAPAQVDLSAVDDRVIRYVFSTGAVARDGHTINQNGWDFTGFDLNSVFLWGHDSGAPPIGKVIEKSVRNGTFGGAVQYIERDIYPFADMVFQMVKGRYLNAVSTSWMPIEWKWSQDKNRVGGIDFIKQDLLEISQVSVPAQINAIATARAAGIDTSPMFEWAERILDGGGKVIVPRAELEQLRREAKMPKAAPKKTERAITSKTLVRGLYSVSSLAALLSSLSWLQEDVQWEAEIEADGSDVPARLLAILKELGQVLIDMTEEEVKELLGVEDGELVADDAVDAVIEQHAKTPAQRFLAKLGCLTRKASPDVVTAQLSAQMRTIEEKINGLGRAGKVLSAASLQTLTTAMEHHRAMGDCIQGMIDATSADDESETQAAPVAAASEADALAARKRHLQFLELSAD